MGSTPSEYEQRAWQDLSSPRPRRVPTRAAEALGRGARSVVSGVGDAAQRTIPHSSEVTRWERSLTAQVHKATAAVSRQVHDHAGGKTTVVLAKVSEGAFSLVSRLATVGLSPARIARLHERRGHPVTSFSDLRTLDLEQIDAVRPRNLDIAYAAAAATAGATAGLLVTGAEIADALAILPTGGASNAPTVGAVLATLTADQLVTLGLSAAVVGHVGCYYGYDPARAEEKVFALAVLNWGTAATAGVKDAAFADLARLSQMLWRGKTWNELNRTATARLMNAFAAKFTTKTTANALTKKSLGKLVPGVAIGTGLSLNWLTLERIADAADVAYRRRFLLDKYPELAEAAPAVDPLELPESADGVDEESTSVLRLLEDEGIALPEDDEEPEDAEAGGDEPRA